MSNRFIRKIWYNIRMRKLFFYLIILKKAFLLAIYPLFTGEGKIRKIIRKNIENYLIFQPSKLRAKRVNRALLKQISPQRFLNSEGIKLYAWFIAPIGDKPVILYLHGQAESILTHQDIALYCKNNGYGLFMLSYRGHYKSGGKASEQGVYNDAQTAVNHLKHLGVDSDKIILWGHSLGTVIALETAIHNNVLGVILQSPIKEIKSAAIDLNNFYYGRLHLNAWGGVTRKYIESMNFLQKMDSMSKIKEVKCPILLLHSKTDRIAPYTNSIELGAQNKNAEVYISETGTHWDANWCIPRAFEFIKATCNCY